MPEISFVIPYCNEAGNLPRSLDLICSLAVENKWDYEVIAVNDKSNDDTAARLDEYAEKSSAVHVIHRSSDGITGNTMGRALQEGTQQATGDIVIWTMGDCSDDVQTYVPMVDMIRGGMDLVIASRYMSGGSSGDLNPFKAFLSANGTRLAKLLFGLKVADITNAFRAFRREKFLALDIKSRGFDISPEFAIKANYAGFNIGQTPTVYSARKVGSSHFNLFKMSFIYMSLFLKLFIIRK